jgi:hypothetical protein
MKKFREWMDERERRGKLIAMRRWLWNQEHGHDHQKGAPPPVSKGDPDFEWINRKAARLGPLDPNKQDEDA